MSHNMLADQGGDSDAVKGGLSTKRYARATRVTNEAISRGDIAGSASPVYRHGEEAYFSAQGFQNLSTQKAMQRDTIFYLASMTKPVTAVAVMLLVEAGTLRLEDAVDRWLPELANRQVLDDLSGVLDQTLQLAFSWIFLAVFLDSHVSSGVFPARLRLCVCGPCCSVLQDEGKRLDQLSTVCKRLVGNKSRDKATA
jgi:hypothetical protein